MGTRGMYGFYRDGETKATYNHFDSYPEVLGLAISKFVSETSIDELNRIFDNIIMVDGDSEPTDEQITEAIKYHDSGVSTGQVNEWYSLLRNSQGDLNVYKGDKPLPFMIDDSEFIKDSLFCEWAYIINLESNILEVYKGFQKEVQDNRYYDFMLNDKEYKNCRLITEIPFSQISNFMNIVLNAIE